MSWITGNSKCIEMKLVNAYLSNHGLSIVELFHAIDFNYKTIRYTKRCAHIDLFRFASLCQSISSNRGGTRSLDVKLFIGNEDEA